VTRLGVAEPRPARLRVYRTTVADSWRWMRVDLFVRLIPLTIAPFLVAWITNTPLSDFGLTLAHPLRDVVISIPLGIAGFLVAAGFAAYLARRSGRLFVPDTRDLLTQCAYYIVLNAPIEEWFFRGFLQGGLNRWLGIPALAVVVATAVFGGYHFLDRWGWRPVVGATFAGLALGLIYLWQPAPPSLLTPTLVHGAITCGFLGLGPYLFSKSAQVSSSEPEGAGGDQHAGNQ
jgi:membrane protease YdiL (CAAX protease family)